MSPPEGIPLEGELNCWNRGFDMPDLLLSVCSTGKTGLLRFVSSEAEKTLFLRDGEVVFAKSSSVDDRLGEYLLRTGKIGLRDLMRHTGEVKPGKRLGALLVEGGILDAKGLVQAVIGQVRAIVLSLFRWSEAWYGFDEQELPSKETITLNMPVARIILDGVQRIDSWRRVAQGVGENDSIYAKIEGNEETIRALDLETKVLEILAILNQPTNVEDICASSPVADFEVCRLLWAFRCLKWIEQRELPQVESSAVTPSEAADSVESETPVEAKVPAEAKALVENLAEEDAPSKTDAPAVQGTPAEAEVLVIDAEIPATAEVPAGGESSAELDSTVETVPVEVHAQVEAEAPLEMETPLQMETPLEIRPNEGAAPAGSETSFELIEDDSTEPKPEELETPPDSGTSEPTPASASLADLDETPVEVSGVDKSEAPDPASPSPTDFGLPYGTPVAAPGPEPNSDEPQLEFSLEDPISEAQPKNGPPSAESKKPPDESTLDTEDEDMDMDLEGLGMVLGDDRQN